MKPLDAAEGLLASLVDRVAGRVSVLFGADEFDAATFPREVVKEVARRVEVVGGETFVPHRIQLFAAESVDKNLGPLREALFESVERHVTEWAEREGHRLLKPVTVNWLVMDLDGSTGVTINASFGSKQSRAQVNRLAEGVTRPQGEWREPELPPTRPYGSTAPPLEPEPPPPWGQLVQGSSALFLTGSPVLGRHADADLVLDSDTVSSRHARLRWDDGRCFIEDLGSTNGTMINGHAVRGVGRIRSGDELRLGDVAYRLELFEGLS